MSDLTHLTPSGDAQMVDVSDKDATARTATAEGRVMMSGETLARILDGTMPKGDVFAAARIAGIMAAKRTSDIIPLCHPIAITGATVEIAPLPSQDGVLITASVKTTGPTGVEMEALTAVSVAALTLYDMIKAVERSASIEGVRLMHKEGGKSGVFTRETPRTSAAAPRPAARSRVSAQRAPARAKPATLMGNVAGPKAPPADDQRRENFRRFMTENHMRALSWAKDAGLSAGVIYGYLHGKVRRLAPEVEAALAKAARTSVKSLFGDD